MNAPTAANTATLAKFAPNMALTLSWVAALLAALLLPLLLGADDAGVAEPEAGGAEDAGGAGGAVPVGTEKPVTEPEKGPAGAEAEAPCPIRAPSPCYL